MLLVPCINFFWHFTNVYDDFPVACLRSKLSLPNLQIPSHYYASVNSGVDHVVV